MMFILTFSSTVTTQDDANLVNDLLNTANILNETLLEITALSDEEENAIGEELDKQISQDLRFTSEKKFNIKKIFNNLTKYVERTKINYNYKIARTDEVNAYAIAGGNI
jgi:predicted Zn-dependent protease